MGSSDGRVKYQILPHAFRDVVCAGYDHKLVRDALIKCGLMSQGEKEHPGQSQLRVPGLGRQRVYVIEIEDEKDEPSAVTGGTGGKKGIGDKPVTGNLL